MASKFTELEIDCADPRPRPLLVLGPWLRGTRRRRRHHHNRLPLSCLGRTAPAHATGADIRAGP